MTTSRALTPSLLWMATGMPRPLSWTVIPLDSVMATSMVSQ